MGVNPMTSVLSLTSFAQAGRPSRSLRAIPATLRVGVITLGLPAGMPWPVPFADDFAGDQMLLQILAHGLGAGRAHAHQADSAAGQLLDRRHADLGVRAFGDRVAFAH